MKKKINNKTILFASFFFIFSVILNCFFNPLEINSKKDNNNNENDNNSGNFTNDQFGPWEGGYKYYEKWNKGPTADPNYFPICIWLQSPSNINAYKEISINTFIGIWEGPTESNITQFTNNNMPVICTQDLDYINKNIIKGWMHIDEPDNAQWVEESQTWGPPVETADVITLYQNLITNDPDRPVYLNLGWGVAWDQWYGRGVRKNHPEDYIEYIKGADIISYDIYPININEVEVKEKIWLVAYGVDRLRQWSNYKKIVWNWIECTQIRSTDGRKPLPSEVKAEIWMSIIHGSMGIGYFAHVMEPFDEPGLLHDTVMKNAVGIINSQITSLAAVLNTPSVTNGVTLISSDANIPVDVMLKRNNSYTYLFCVSMRPGNTVATFTLRDFPAEATAEVLGENRQININNGVFNDEFSNYSVHLYKIK